MGPMQTEAYEEQMRDLVKECGLDWQRGYMPLFDGDPTNRYAVLIEAVVAAERKRWTEAAMTELDSNGQAHVIVTAATRA